MTTHHPTPSDPETGQRWSRQDTRALVAVLVLASLVRLAYLVAYSRSDWWAALIMDPGNHWTLAGRIADGQGMGPYAFFRAPLYLYLLAGLRAFLGDSLWPIRVVQALAGTATCGMIFVLARRLGLRAGGLLAALVYSVWWVPVYFDGELLTDSPAAFLNLLLLLLLDRAESPGAGRRWWLAAGLAAGLSAVTRPNILLFAVAVAVALGWRAVRSRAGGAWRRPLAAGVVFGFGVLLPVAPVTVRNLAAAGDFVLIASQGGINFWLGNHAGADGRTVVVPVPRRDIPLDFLDRRPDHPWLREDVWLASAYGADTGMKRRSTESEISDYWYGQAWDWIASNPGAALGLTARKALFLAQGREVSNNRDLAYHRSHFAVLRWSPVSFGWLAPLALAGIALGLTRDFRPRLFWPLLFLGCYGASVVMFFVTTRYRVPMLPVFALLAGVLVDEIVTRARAGEWRRAAGWVALAAALAVPVNLDWPAWNDRPLRSAMRYNLGIALVEQGRYPAAERELRAALEIKAAYPEAWFWLGLALGREGRPADAAAALERSVEQGPGYAPAWFELSRAYRALGRGAEADRALGRARQLAPETFGR